MKINRLGNLLLALSALMAYSSTRAAVVISEVTFNEVSSDTTGEWIEIYNTGLLPVDLSNYKIGDEETSGGTSTTESLYKFPAGAMINPGEVQVIAVGATRFNTVYGFNPTYETSGTDLSVPDLSLYTTWDPDGGQINMSNTNDQAVLVDNTDTIIDAVSWGNTFAFNPAVDITGNLDGQSIERKNVLIDTNSASDWMLGPATSPAATRSTPFAVSVPEANAWLLMLACALGASGWRVLKVRINS
jgi:hypothetical protein